ncbi:PIN domain-containing protein [Virgibacillus kimchii]
MKIIDANVLLRYLLNDVEELTERAVELIENNNVYISNEVIAKVVYVLQKVGVDFFQFAVPHPK